VPLQHSPSNSFLFVRINVPLAKVKSSAKKKGGSSKTHHTEASAELGEGGVIGWTYSLNISAERTYVMGILFLPRERFFLESRLSYLNRDKVGVMSKHGEMD